MSEPRLEPTGLTRLKARVVTRRPATTGRIRPTLRHGAWWWERCEGGGSRGVVG